MSIYRSLRHTAPSALHRTALTRTPVAGTAVILATCMPHRQMSASPRQGTSRPIDMAVAFITVIVPPDLIPSVQIPIAHRRR
jgi:hypothetical protein